MLESLLHTVWTRSWRRARSGSRAWTAVAVAAGGLRLIRFVARDREDILYRTRVKPGDQFEIVASAAPGKRRRK